MRPSRPPNRTSATLLIICFAVAFSLIGATIALSFSVKGRSGRYTGKAGPFTINFEVTAGGKRISDLETTFDPGPQCSVPVGGITHTRFPALTVDRGHFQGNTATGSGFTATHYAIKGAFTSATQASGTVSGRFRTLHNALPPCHSAVRFAAMRIAK